MNWCLFEQFNTRSYLFATRSNFTLILRYKSWLRLISYTCLSNRNSFSFRLNLNLWCSCCWTFKRFDLRWFLSDLLYHWLNRFTLDPHVQLAIGLFHFISFNSRLMHNFGSFNLGNLTKELLRSNDEVAVTCVLASVNFMDIV